MISPNTINQTGFFPQIDALRAIAVAMVVFSHWAGYHNDLWSDTSIWFNGEVGVQLFFIISGFLITGILLDERLRAETAGDSGRSILKAFYSRRFLRIFPLFYGTLFAGYALGHPDVLNSIGWHLTYLSNFLFARRGEYMGDVSHFWSLAVEEQFYLLWPMMILFLPKRILLQAVVACMLFGPIFRFLMLFVLNANEVAANVLPFSSLDSLAGGALLAILYRNNWAPSRIRIAAWFIRACVVSGIAYVALRTVIPVPATFESAGLFLSRTLMIPGLAAIVWFIAHGLPGRAGAVLQSKPLSYIGKISYGVYVFHFFIPGITAWLCYKADFLVWERYGMSAYLFVNTAALLTLSALSWHFFEKPINDLKQFFPYSKEHDSSAPRFGWTSIPYIRLFARRTS